MSKPVFFVLIDKPLDFKDGTRNTNTKYGKIKENKVRIAPLISDLEAVIMVKSGRRSLKSPSDRFLVNL
jgi:hypothetical protein